MRISFRVTSETRTFLFIIADLILIIVSVFLAFLLRFDLRIPQQYFEGLLPITIILTLVFCLPIFYFSRLYSFSWAYVSTSELVSLAKAVSLSFLFLGVALLILRDQSFLQGFPRSVLFIEYILIFISCGTIRFTKRIYLELFQKEKERKERTLIVGAGDVGEQILRSILISKKSSYLPVGFVDDNAAKKGVIIHGVKVLGKIDDIPKIVKKNQIEQMIIALPSVGTPVIKKAVEKGRESGLKKIKHLPLIEIIDGVSLSDLREVRAEDLLGREPILLDLESIDRFVRGKKILITGAAGSIGSELSRQIAKFSPSLLLLLDKDETGIFNIDEEFGEKFSYLRIISLIADIKDEKKINQIFEEFEPDIVFHAAAYKHVPLMEKNPDEAVKNNIFGTEIVAKAALKCRVDRFVFISTDKAVNPTSVMGATKRIGEMICQSLNQKNHTKFISVRFGNVLDSQGSVIPIFREQIKKREPLKVTHPEMKRYFMTITEACLLVMQAGQMGQGGEVFVLNMGKPIKILDLAKEMIKLSGLEPDKDIPIVFTKPRPGEKLFEEILSAEEGTVATQNKKIFKAKLLPVNKNKLEKELTTIKILAEQTEKDKIMDAFKFLIPSYRPQK